MPRFKDTIQELYELRRFSIKMGLDNITALCELLGNPHREFRSIHVAGTNGKGTTSAILHGILTSHGIKCGLYISPHLMDFRERIRIDDKYISKHFLINSWKRIARIVKSQRATFFDATTAIAFDYFYRNRVDIAVVETGLGGRLDSTNIIKPEVAILTPIHFDHVKQLGDNLSSIAGEKAAIIKPDCAVFVAKQSNDVLSVIKKNLKSTNILFKISETISIKHIRLSRQYSVFDLHDKYRQIKISNIHLNLAGKFQIENAALAYLVSRWYLENNSKEFSENIFRNSLRTIKWPGRIQCIHKKPNVYLDVSHNYSGIRSTLEFFTKKFDLSETVLLLGILADKSYSEIVKLIYPYFNKVVVTEPLSDRRLDGRKLAQEFLRYKIKVTFIKEIDHAFDFCMKNLKSTDTLLVMGSHFLIGPLMAYLQKKHLTSD